ncbi:hypothetical protein AIOL_004794 [Candidatus Rhodobacter oscarellae]|uniref:AI-2E family transporter n=1 Tax=Candidatus Rhodobacter oscarellae TaxID=1675527 RepID=A0A0J9EAI7_9RHOB|nr:hypothetical protein [Candidatus Rhodobacter lobularis]KMW59810.1 hypothetical protein AIOL_004794 [Candidatus Rhodobacter lobularis]
MTASQAKWVERIIIGLCVLSILFIFQPFYIELFTIGCVSVVVGALAFNLVPFCREGVPARALVKVSVIILAILGVAAALGYGTALLYVAYIETLR